MHFRKRLPYETGLNTLHLVPFITVMCLLLLLILFFARFCPPGGMRLGASDTAQKFPAETEVIQITLSGGMWYFDGRQVSDVQLESFLSTVAFRKPAVLIRAAHDSPLGPVMRVWRMCGQAGIGRVSLVTD